MKQVEYATKEWPIYVVMTCMNFYAKEGNGELFDCSRNCDNYEKKFKVFAIKVELEPIE